MGVQFLIPHHITQVAMFLETSSLSPPWGCVTTVLNQGSTQTRACFWDLHCAPRGDPTLSLLGGFLPYSGTRKSTWSPTVPGFVFELFSCLGNVTFSEASPRPSARSANGHPRPQQPTCPSLCPTIHFPPSLRCCVPVLGEPLLGQCFVCLTARGKPAQSGSLITLFSDVSRVPGAGNVC